MVSEQVELRTGLSKLVNNQHGAKHTGPVTTWRDLVVHVPSRSDALWLLAPTAVNRRPNKKHVAIML